VVSSKRQQTFAKMERERRVKERRVLKQEKKQAAAAAKIAAAAGTLPVETVGQDETALVTPADGPPEQ
jgi:hypothetical protein